MDYYLVVDSTSDFAAMCQNLAFSFSLYSGQMCTAPQNVYLPAAGVATEDGVGPDMNAVTGTVEDVVFVGEMRRYIVALPGGQRLVLKAQNRSGVRNYERGDAIRVAWSCGDCRLV